jgi:hypothetical protein
MRIIVVAASAAIAAARISQARLSSKVWCAAALAAAAASVSIDWRLETDAINGPSRALIALASAERAEAVAGPDPATSGARRVSGRNALGDSVCWTGFVQPIGHECMSFGSGRSIQPISVARRTAWARSTTPSFAYALWMWLLIVLALRPWSCAMVW